MKYTFRTIAMILIISSFISLFGTFAFAADHQTGLERFEGVSKKEKNSEKVKEIYEDLIYRAYVFDDSILLPNLEDMNDFDEIKIKYIQSKRGEARAQSIYDGPDGNNKWAVKDGAMVKVYAKYKDYSFVEVMMNSKESEGTIGWVPTTYVVDTWSATVSASRTAKFS